MSCLDIRNFINLNWNPEDNSLHRSGYLLRIYFCISVHHKHAMKVKINDDANDARINEKIIFCIMG